MLTVALTGGIASGKTAVSNAFSDLGVPVVDADVLSREAVEPESPGLKAITKRFGQTVINSDGSLNRKALRQIVFNDAQSRKDLEAIVLW
jgi:dephospho-CoA kinase